MFEIIRSLKHKPHNYNASVQFHIFSGMLSKHEDREEYMKRTYNDKLAYGEPHQLYRTQEAYISRPQPSPGDFGHVNYVLLLKFGLMRSEAQPLRYTKWTALINDLTPETEGVVTINTGHSL